MAHITTETLDLAALSRDRGGSRSLRAFLARPEGAGPWPSVVLVMEVFGVNEGMRAHARRIASWGYVVVVPDLYSDGGARRCLYATMKAMVAGEGRALVDIETARLWALDRQDTTDAVGVIGFCMGGGFALLTCDRDRYDVAAVNYGRLPGQLGNSCPVVASYGARDRTLRGTAGTLEDELTARHIPHDVKEYATAGHSFLNDGTPGPAALAPLLHVAGVGGTPADREDAWSRIETYFAQHLGS